MAMVLAGGALLLILVLGLIGYRLGGGMGFLAVVGRVLFAGCGRLSRGRGTRTPAAAISGLASPRGLSRSGKGAERIG